MNRYLTKSRFRLACECPTKLYYTGKPEYANQNEEDSFLQAMADGGYQVGELAKFYVPGGVEVKAQGYDEALKETAALLEKDEVVIYEAALAAGNLFVRVDILRKSDGRINLYEVKAKSFEPSEKSLFWTKGGGMASGWRATLEDVAFQKHVAMAALPGAQVVAHLMLVDKTVACPVEGLNQKFMVTRDATGRRGIQVSAGLSSADLKGPRLIQALNVDGECAHLFHEQPDESGLDFEGRIRLFSESYAEDLKITPVISKECKNCEFAAAPADQAAGLKNGRVECWKSQLPGWTDAEIMGPTVLDIWSFRNKEKLIAEQRIRLTEVTEEDLNLKPGDRGLSVSERQWLQVEKAQQKDESIFFDRAGMADEMAGWTFPLHFIDFETSMVALPFHKGRKPYEGIAFQFSHHTVGQDGKVEHKDEYLNAKRGEFPNYDFVRALKKALSDDEGTIFRYAAHENSFLNHIHQQLQEDATVPDRAELMGFIEEITKSSGKQPIPWEGKRSMVDMLELVKKYYYAPEMGGSNSIKYVLPATLRRSEYLKGKYSKPVYGAEKGIKSLNFKEMKWVQEREGKIQDPYSLLPPIFTDVDPRVLKLSSEDDELKEGGAALAAYGRLQFEEMGEQERKAIEKALLKYCELDTLAMVMIYEAWREWMLPRN